MPPRPPVKTHRRGPPALPREGATRTCVVSREAYPPERMVHLVAGLDGFVEIDRSGKLDGRGAWVFPHLSHLNTLESKPQILAKALKAPGIKVEGLRPRVLAAAWARVLELLSLAARAGQVAGGAEQLTEALKAGQLRLVLLASDTSEESIAKIKSSSGSIPCVKMELDKEALGARVGKGPRAALGLRAGSLSRAIAEQLPRIEELR